MELYPAGCPRRRLKAYFTNQLDCDEADIDDLITLMDVDSQGTIPWDDVQDFLFKMKTNIANRQLFLARNQTTTILEDSFNVRQQGRDIKEKLQDQEERILQQVERIQQMLSD